MASAEEIDFGIAVVPQGTPISFSTTRVCGAPTSVEECMDDGWMKFTFPRTFSSQGDAIQYVITGK